MLRNLLHIRSRVGMPGTILQLGDAGGRVLYLSTEMSPIQVVVGLEREDVEQLHEVCAAWLRDQDEREDPAPFGRVAEPIPLVAGAIRRGLLSPGGTVQVRTVREP